MMYTWLHRIFLLCSLLGLFVASHAQEVSLEEAAQDSAVVHVVAKINFPPFEYLDTNNQPNGMGIEVFREVMREAQISYVLEMLSAKECFARLKDGRADLMVGASSNPERKDYILFSVPFAYLYSSFICYKESPILTTSDLRYRRVAVTEGLLTKSRLESIPDIKSMYMPTPIHSLLATDSGTVEVTMLPAKVAHHYIKELELDRLDVRYAGFEAVDYSIGVSKHNPMLLGKVNIAMQNIKANGVYYDIYKKWNGIEKAGLTKEQILMFRTSLIWLVLSVVAIALLVHMLQKRLKREKLANQQLHKQQVLLEQQADELAVNQQTILEINKDLQKQVEKAERANKLKTNFLANMSHEIRTPLNSIIGFTDVLMEDKSLSEDEVSEYVDIIHMNNELLLHLINDILDLSKLEAGFMDQEYSRFDLVKLINEEYKALSSQAQRRKLESVLVSPATHCFIYFDKGRMAQVLNNFISNALKYTAQGNIELGYEVLKHGVRVYVHDTGIGIAADKHDQVFKRFEKIDSFTQGTGLGLSICKAILDNVGGEIGFESVEGVGSTFWAIFPCEVNVEKSL